MSRPRLRQRATRAASLALVAASVVEGAGALGYLWLERGFFYARPRVRGGENAPDRRSRSLTSVLHPTLGFIWRPGMPLSTVADRDRLDLLAGRGATPAWADLKANNFGFFSAEDYPTPPRPGDFLVGVFGGSVAQWFALQGGPVLGRELGRSPAAGSRSVRILNFGQGGHKQPQQLVALLYFLSRGQQLDLVINLDGFNEVALGRQNAERLLEPTLPSAAHLAPLAALMTPGLSQSSVVEAVAAEIRAERRKERARAGLAQARLAGLWLWRRFELASAERDLVRARETLAAPHGESGSASLLHLNRLDPAASWETSLPSVVRQWAEASAMMAAVLGARGIPYLHVLQPNQHYGAHRFTDVEGRLAKNPASPYRLGVITGYPMLVERLEALQRQGVPAASAVGVFDAEARAVYADDCCHLNQLGNDQLARFVAARASRLLGDVRSERPAGR